MRLGIATRSCTEAERFMFAFPSPSSKAKHLVAKGKGDQSGNRIEIFALNSATIEDAVSPEVQSATPITPRGNEETRNRLNGERHVGGGLVTNERWR